MDVTETSWEELQKAAVDKHRQVEGESPLPEESGTPDNQKRAEGKAGRPHHSPDPQATLHLHNDNV